MGTRLNCVTMKDHCVTLFDQRLCHALALRGEILAGLSEPRLQLVVAVAVG